MLNLLYDRLTLQGVLDKSKRPYSFLRDTFFSTVIEHQTEEFGFDIIRGGEQVAPFVHPEIGGKMLDKSGYITRTFAPPEVSPEKIITSKDLENRLAGEAINGRESFEARQIALAARFLREIDESISRREEIMSASALMTGQIVVEGEGYNRTVIDYWPSAAADQPYLDIGASDSDKYWGGTAASILDDLIAAADRIEDKSNSSPTMAILGSAAAAALRNDQDLWKKMDNRRINPGELSTRRLGGGVRYLGTLLDSGLELYTYRGHYRDPVSGLRVPLVPENRVLVGSRDSGSTMNYGLVTTMNEETELMERIARSRVPDSWVQRKKPAGRILQIKSRPLPVIRDTDAFFVLKVLSGS